MSHIIFCFAVFLNSVFSFAEYYSERPDILDVEAIAHVRDNSFELLKESHLDAVAQILGMYPLRKIFFLARDGELLYDLARVLSHELHLDEDLNRIRLVNISRLNMTSPHLKNYLEQEGLREDELRAGYKVLFVDTGFSGTIPKTIQELFDEELRDQIQTHLMCSDNSNHPSTRVFLKSLNPFADKIHPSNLHGTIIDYEHRPRYTKRSNEFHYSDGTWQPYSPEDDSTNDGAVSRAEALLDMQALKAFALLDESKRRYQERKLLWSLLHDNLHEKNSERIFSLLCSSTLTFDPLRDAIIRDADDMAKTNFAAHAAHMPSLSEFGLKIISDRSTKLLSKTQLIAAHPEWQLYVQDPQSGIEQLFRVHDFHTVRAISDVYGDAEWISWLTTKLGRKFGNPNTAIEARYTARTLVENGEREVLDGLVRRTFLSPHVTDWKSELTMLIDRVATYDCHSLVKLFAKAHAINWPEQFDHLIMKCAEEAPQSFVVEVFSQPHAHAWQDKLINFYETTSPSYRSYFHVDFFTRQDSAPFTKSFDHIVRTAESELFNLANAFAHPHSKNWQPQLKILIERGSQKELAHIAEVAFALSHSQAFDDELERLIERGDEDVHAKIVSSVFRSTHAQIWHDKLIFIMTTASPTGLQKMEKKMDRYKPRNDFISRTVQHCRYHLIMHALSISDAHERKEYLTRALAEMTNEKNRQF